jgi:hypothetical protein
VTVTHPLHPLCGQRLEVVRVRRGADPDLIVRLPDGRHAALAQSSTADALPQLPADPPEASTSMPLLDVDGLRHMVALIARIRNPDRTPRAEPAGGLGIVAPPPYAAAHPPAVR